MIRSLAQRHHEASRLRILTDLLRDLGQQGAPASQIDDVVQDIEMTEAQIRAFDRISRVQGTRSTPFQESDVVPGFDLSTGAEQINQALFAMRTLARPGESQASFAKYVESAPSVVQKQEKPEPAKRVLRAGEYVHHAEHPTTRDYRLKTLRTWARACGRSLMCLFVPRYKYGDPSSIAVLGLEAAATKYFFGPAYEAASLRSILSRFGAIAQAECVTCYVLPVDAAEVLLFHSSGVRNRDSMRGRLRPTDVPSRLINRHGCRFVRSPADDPDFAESKFVARESIVSVLYTSFPLRGIDGATDRLLVFLNYRRPVPEPSREYLNAIESIEAIVAFVMHGASPGTLKKEAETCLTEEARWTPGEIVETSPMANILLEELADELAKRGIDGCTLTLHVVDRRGNGTPGLPVRASFPVQATNDVIFVINDQRGFVPLAYMNAAEGSDPFVLVEDLEMDPRQPRYMNLPANLQTGDMLSEFALALFVPSAPRGPTSEPRQIWGVLNAESTRKKSFNRLNQDACRRLFEAFGDRLWVELGCPTGPSRGSSPSDTTAQERAE